MRKLCWGLLLVLWLAIPANALELRAPEVTGPGLDVMPENTDSFGEGLLELLRKGAVLAIPELETATRDCCGVLAAAMVCALLPVLSRRVQGYATLAGTVSIAAMLMEPAGAMLACAVDTLQEICDYGKLLCPVMTAALAAQGGITTSAALYTGTTAFISLLSMLVSRMMIPMVALFLTLSVGYSALGEDLLKKTADAVKRFLSWLLKTVLIVFTTYMSITGVVSGTTDAAARKAAKVAISSVVPLVGGVLSDASEAVLVSMGVAKNAAGVYGILAVLAMLTGPFLKVGTQYLLLKLTGALCGIWGDKRITGLVEDYSTAMGLLLALVATGCVLVLISTVCFMKGMEF